MKHNGMRPQDILILLKIALTKEVLSQKQLSLDLLISPSEVSESLTRSVFSGLISSNKKKVRINTFYEFLIYGLPYVFPVQPGAIVKGIPTGSSASPLDRSFTQEMPYVWPSPNGTKKGVKIEPLYATVPEIASSNVELYKALALIDAIRIGNSRERNMAVDLLKKMML